ncbi:hypothetical protein JL722_13232 [Aureococcus anophagefferens]|nr:hypothetical protein JL722_13232 [Aureococcus anophagefferens]
MSVATAFPTTQGVPAPGPRCLACANCCVVFASAPPAPVPRARPRFRAAAAAIAPARRGARAGTGFVFLCLIGQLLARQPLYVVGVDNPSVASNKCFGAAFTYLFIVVVSIATLVYDKARPKAAVSSNYSDMGQDMSFLGSDATAERDRRRASRAQERDALAGLEMQSMPTKSML